MNIHIYHHVPYALIYTRLARLTRIKINIHVYMPVYSLSMELLQLPMTMMILPWSYYERVDIYQNLPWSYYERVDIYQNVVHHSVTYSLVTLYSD